MESKVSNQPKEVISFRAVQKVFIDNKDLIRSTMGARFYDACIMSVVEAAVHAGCSISF